MTTSNPGHTLDIEERESISAPKEITFEEFMDGLEILPPIGHVMYSSTESFKWSEFLCGRVTRVYCRIEKRYFCMENIATLRHDDIVRIVRDAMTPLRAPSASLGVCQHG